MELCSCAVILLGFRVNKQRRALKVKAEAIHHFIIIVVFHRKIRRFLDLGNPTVGRFVEYFHLFALKLRFPNFIHSSEI